MAPKNQWPDSVRKARVHFVSGKGGSGKTTIAAALALSLASEGKNVLLVECEGRQGIAQFFDIPPLPPTETKVATAEGGGQVTGLAIEIEHALLEYLDMFYNLGFAGRAMRKIGAIDFVTTIAPGLRDVILTGKIKECAIRVDKKTKKLVYDAVVIDAPPTGRIGNFLDVTTAMANLAKTGPIKGQSDGVIKLLHSNQTVVHLTTLLESMPVQETIEAVAELNEKNLQVGIIFVNRAQTSYLPKKLVDSIASGIIDADGLRTGLADAGLTISDDDFHGLLTETIEHATRIQAQSEARDGLAVLDRTQVDIPNFEEGIDLGELYEISELLTNLSSTNGT